MKVEDRCCSWIFDHSTYQAWRTGNTPSPVLWVYGPPGSGKSTLCRNVVRALTKESSVTIASHYFRFDQDHSTLDVLKSLSAQLFDSYLSTHPACDSDSDSFVSKLAGLAADRKTDVKTRVPSILQELALHLPAVHFFLDGVDEDVAKPRGFGATPPNALDVLAHLDTFVAPTRQRRDQVRMWITSQNLGYRRNQKFNSYTPFDIKDAVKTGISEYLACSVGNLEFIPQDRRNAVLQSLLDRVESNFLWAHLITVELGKATDSAGLKNILEEGQAKDLDEYYCKFLNRLLHRSREEVELARCVTSKCALHGTIDTHVVMCSHWLLLHGGH